MMTKAEFCERFAAHMLKHSRERPSRGGSMEDYARAVAATYYDDDFQDDPSLTPEECAAADMSSWEGRTVTSPSSLLTLLPGTAVRWALFRGRIQRYCRWKRRRLKDGQ